MTKITNVVDKIKTVEWFEHHICKAGKKAKSVLTEDGFIREVLSESKLLIDEVEKSVKAKSVSRLLKKLDKVDWYSLSVREANEIVKELQGVIEKLPAKFGKKVSKVIDSQTKKVVEKAHKDLGKRYSNFAVSNVFVAENKVAVDAISSTTSIFFSKQYETRAKNFGPRVQKTIASGLKDGLGNREIARELKREFAKTAIAESYWETVASVHVARARSFSELATFASNGIEKYEIVAVEDERTTEICKAMNGAVLSVKSGLNSFDKFEDAESLEKVREVAPFMVARGDDVFVKTKDGLSRVASKKDGGGYSRLSSAKLNQVNINTPPYHFRCRTTIVPVIED